MNETRTETLDVSIPARTVSWRDWFSLTKPEITFLVVISALAGFILASENGVDGWLLFWALTGIGLSSAGGCALNHYLERDLDATMKRTAYRPVPSGRISPEQAKWYGFILVAAGVGLLCPLTNPLTGVLAAATVALYLFVYTPMKRTSKWNTLVGTLPGALPVLGGWTAATGSVGAGGWALFGVLLCWQMPHFFALAWMYKKDYEKGGFAMLTVTDTKGQSTANQMLGFTIAMIGFSVVPVFLGLSSWVYLVGALALGIWFLLPVSRFYLTRSVLHAREVLKASVLYIPLLLAAIVVDRLVG
jgi:protoheme IX farnesyltransferase